MSVRRVQAAERYPGAELDLRTREVRNLPNSMGEWQTAGFPRRE